MMRKKMVLHYLTVFVLILFTVGPISLKGNQEKKLEQYLEIELKRVEETYRLLERFGEEIWPGWNNYNDIGFRTHFPNGVLLVVNPRRSVPKGYEQLQGRTVYGKSIFINRENELPMEMKLPLTGAAGGGLTIKARLSLPGTPTTGPDSELRPSSDRQIIMYVHEAFHGFQEKFDFMPVGDAVLKFMSNTEFATYSNIEGLALIRAHNETDNDKALEYLKDYFMAHEIKQKFMTPEMVDDEHFIATQEGTAAYAEVKMAMCIRDNKYKPGITSKDDPFFFNFQDIDAYIEMYSTKYIRKEMADTLDTFGRCYPFGAYQCFFLDRFTPGWKQDFFKSQKNLDDLITNLLKLSPTQKKKIAKRLKTRYPYDEIYAKHDAVIKERDQAVQMVKNRKGTKYIIDMIKIREWFKFKAHKKRIFIKGIEWIYPHGIEPFQLADIQITTKDTPIHRTWLHTYEWIDTKPNTGNKGYKITFKTKEGETYKNLVFQAKGFTLKAPEAQIKENKAKNEIRIVVLSQVAR
jgi:hypothetical protein